MRWQWVIVGVAVIAAVKAGGQTGRLALTLELKPPKVIAGGPLGFTIRWHNNTDAPVALSTYDAQGFKRWIAFRKPDGAIVHGPWESRSMPKQLLAPGEAALFEDDLQGNEHFLLSTPGRYQVWAEYESPGRFYEEGQVFGEPPRYHDFWKGSVSSNVCDLEVTEPTGLDREAYDRYEGQPMRAADLLRDFPTSTYGAYVVWEMTGAKGAAQSDPAKVADALRNGLRAVARSVACPPAAGCDPNENLVGQNPAEVAIDRSARWIDIVLKAHPDIWFADELRLRLALDEIASGKSSLGAADLEALSKNARPDIAQKAGQLLTLVKEKGLVK